MTVEYDHTIIVKISSTKSYSEIDNIILTMRKDIRFDGIFDTNKITNDDGTTVYTMNTCTFFRNIKYYDKADNTHTWMDEGYVNPDKSLQTLSKELDCIIEIYTKGLADEYVAEEKAIFDKGEIIEAMYVPVMSYDEGLDWKIKQFDN